MGDDIKIRIITEDKSSRKNKKIANSLDDIKRSSSNAGNKISGLASAIKFGLVGAIGVGIGAVAGLTSAITSSVNEAADMEQQVANIAATMQLTSQETSIVKDLIKDLGIDPQLKVSAVEAGQAIEMLGKNGVKLDDILSGAAKSSILLANSTGADLAQAADIATDAMLLFGIEASDMMSAVNGITGVTTNSKFGIEDYALALAQGGAAAKIAGLDMSEFNTAIAGISSNFASGSDAGTSFKTFLTRLAAQTGPAQESMVALGLRTEDTANAFFDAEGNMKSMAEISQLLHDATKDLTEEQKILHLSTIFGSDALRAASGIADMTFDSFTELSSSIASTNAEMAATTRIDTFRGAMEILDGVIESVKISIGDNFLPILKDLTLEFANFISNHSDQINAFFAEFARIVKDSIPNIRAFIGFIIQLFTSDELLAASEFGATGSMAAFIDTVSSGILIIGNLVNAVRTLINNIHNAVKPALDIITTAMGNVVTKFSEIIADGKITKDEFVQLFKTLGTELTALGSVLWQWILDSIPVLLEKVQHWGSVLLAEIVNYLPTLGSHLLHAGQILWQWIIDAVPIVIAKLGEWGNSLVTGVTNLIPVLLPKLQDLGILLWNWIVATIPMVFNKLGEWSTSFYNWVTDNAPALGSKFDSWAFNLYDWISNDGTKQKTEQALDTWQNNSFFGKITTMGTSLRVMFNNQSAALFDWIAATIPQTISAITDWLIALMEGTNLESNNQAQAALDESKRKAWLALQNMLVEIGTSLKENAGKLANALFDGMLDQVNARVSGSVEHIRNSFKGIKDAVYHALGISISDNKAHSTIHAANLIFDGLIHGVNTRTSNAITHFRSVFENIKNNMVAFLNRDTFFYIGRDIIQGLIDGINHLRSHLQDLASNLGSWIPQWVRDALQSNSPSMAMFNVGLDATQGLLNALDSSRSVLAATSKNLGETIVGTTQSTVTNAQTSIRNNTFNVSSKPQDSLLSDINSINKLYGTI